MCDGSGRARLDFDSGRRKLSGSRSGGGRRDHGRPCVPEELRRPSRDRWCVANFRFGRNWSMRTMEVVKVVLVAFSAVMFGIAGRFGWLAIRYRRRGDVAIVWIHVLFRVGAGLAAVWLALGGGALAG